MSEKLQRPLAPTAAFSFGWNKKGTDHKPQRDTERRLSDRSPGYPAVSLGEEWKSLWSIRGTGKSGGSWGSLARLPPLPNRFCLLCLKGEGQAKLGLSGLLLARTTKKQFPQRELLFPGGAVVHPGRSHCFCRGFLDQLLAFGALLLQVLRSFCAALLSWT